VDGPRLQVNGAAKPLAAMDMRLHDAASTNSRRMDTKLHTMIPPLETPTALAGGV
jgi:hypothetical protein